MEFEPWTSSSPSGPAETFRMPETNSIKTMPFKTAAVFQTGRITFYEREFLGINNYALRHWISQVPGGTPLLSGDHCDRTAYSPEFLFDWVTDPQHEKAIRGFDCLLEPDTQYYYNVQYTSPGGSESVTKFGRSVRNI
jgi:hypothetical protein